MSEDEAFLGIGDRGFKATYGRELEQYLSDPQQLNSYSYARNNPLVLVDRDGKIPFVVITGTIGLVAGVTVQGIKDYREGNEFHLQNYAIAGARGLIGGVTAGLAPWRAGGITALSLLAEDYLKGDLDTDHVVGALAEGAVTTVTAGYLKGLSGVPGVEPSSITSSALYFGKHTQRYLLEKATDVVVGLYYDYVRDTTNKSINSTNNTSRNSSENLNGGYYMKSDVGTYYCANYECNWAQENK